MNSKVKRVNRQTDKTMNENSDSMDDCATTMVLPQHNQHNTVPQRKSIELNAEAMVNTSVLLNIPPKEGDYSVGDLIWAKVHGYPWWPCMVSVDPIQGFYSKISGMTYKADRVYHVQYFGPQAFRGWTLVGMIMQFEGKDKYFEKVEASKAATAKSKWSKITAKYAIKPSHRKKWDQSVAEAEEAMKYDRETRVKMFTFQYNLVSKPINNKRSADNPIFDVEPKRKKMTSSPEDIYDFDEDMDEIDVDVTKSSPGLMWRKRAQKGDFAQYVKNHFKTVKKENPKSTKQELNDMLKRRWDLLGEDLRALYIPPHSKSHSDQTNDTTPKTPSAKPSNADTADTAKSRSKSNNSRKLKSKQSIIKISLDKVDQNDGSESEADLVINESPVVTVTPKKSVRPKIKKNLDFPANEIPVNGRKSYVSPKKEPIDSKLNSTQSTKKSKKSSGKSNPQPTVEIKSEENGKIAEDVKPTVVSNSEQTLMTLGIDFSDEFASSEDASSTSEPEVSDSVKPSADKFCALCNDEDSETLISCDGPCLQMFHKKCVNFQGNDNQFRCNECKTGEHPCFLCKKLEGVATHKCSDLKCGKFYHISCLEKKNYPIKINGSKDNFLCPLHFCLNCHIESQNDKDFRPSRRRLVKCISCPTAYHLGDYCIAAGTVQVSQNYVICPDHFESGKGKKKKKDKHLNVNYCFSCLTGGQLVCCETCPAAFHDHCLDYSLDADSNFYCTDCTLRKQLRYGDIVWVKLGFYRWWPGKVSHPKSVPDNVMKLAHVVGEFPVYFFGSHDYYWLHKGRVFLFMEGDNKFVTANSGGKKNSKSLMKTFKLAMEEAAEAFQLWNNSKLALRRAMLINKPPPYTHIRSNKPVGKVQIVNANESQINLCECNDKSENPCSDENCINRALMVECDPKLCRAEDRCKNQRFKKREYVSSKPFKTESAGWGLRTLQDISKGQFVIEYVGELIDEEECELRLTTMAKNEQSNFYFLTIDKDKIIDAGPKGNLARFMNHSCQPNCETQKWMVNGATRVGLFAVNDIPTGTELTFNYNLDCRGNEKTKCVCGASNCSGFIGVRPTKTEENGTKKATNGANQKKKKKKIEKKDFEKMHDDDCFTCGEGGDLIMCDRKGCPKSYHMECLKLEQIPKGKWECPRHFCDQIGCGKSATAMCSFCPNSLCKEHAIPSKLTQLPDGGLLCSDHTNDDVNGVLLEPEVSALNDSCIESVRKETETADDNTENNILNNSSNNSLILNSTVESTSDDSKKCETEKDSNDSNELSVAETSQTTID